MKPKKHEGEIVCSFNDWHIPFEDPKAVELEIAWAKAIQPDVIVLHELHDFYELSKFDKDPLRVSNLQKEIDKVDTYLTKLRKECPDARIILINSNHLDRLRKYLWNQAPALSSLRSLHIPELLQLKKHNIEYMEEYLHRGVLYKHGNVVRKFSAYSAKGEFEKENCSGASGHTHRGGIYFFYTRGGRYFWLECGCACKLNPEYIKGVPNWQQGFGVIRFSKTGNHHVPMFVLIDNHQIVWGDNVITLK